MEFGCISKNINEVATIIFFQFQFEYLYLFFKYNYNNLNLTRLVIYIEYKNNLKIQTESSIFINTFTYSYILNYFEDSVFVYFLYIF